MTRLRGALEKLPGQWGRAIGEALFRQRGEVHLWMYDELFLADLREVMEDFSHVDAEETAA